MVVVLAWIGALAVVGLLSCLLFDVRNLYREMDTLAGTCKGTHRALAERLEKLERQTMPTPAAPVISFEELRNQELQKQTQLEADLQARSALNRAARLRNVSIDK